MDGFLIPFGSYAFPRTYLLPTSRVENNERAEINIENASKFEVELLAAEADSQYVNSFVCGQTGCRRRVLWQYTIKIQIIIFFSSQLELTFGNLKKGFEE